MSRDSIVQTVETGAALCQGNLPAVAAVIAKRIESEVKDQFSHQEALQVATIFAERHATGVADGPVLIEAVYGIGDRIIDVTANVAQKLRDCGGFSTPSFRYHEQFGCIDPAPVSISSVLFFFSFFLSFVYRCLNFVFLLLAFVSVSSLCPLFFFFFFPFPLWFAAFGLWFFLSWFSMFAFLFYCVALSFFLWLCRL